MEFFMGLICGWLSVAALTACVLTWLPLPQRAERMNIPAVEGDAPWQETRNFLYYDGTEMPPIKAIKESKNEQ